MGITLSVILCTYNGARRLPATFAALAAQVVDPTIAWDVLVVDNGSQDDTRAIAEDAAKRFAVPFNVLSEKTPGKAHALRLAFNTVQGRLFCIVDDDNLLAPDYLQNAVKFMAANAHVALIAGRIHPQFEEPQHKPADFDTRFARMLACRDHGDEVQFGVTPVGAGMVGRTKLMHSIYEQIGTRLMDRVAAGGGDVGEDLEKEHIIRRLGWEVAYVPSLRLQHVMPTTRLQNEYIDRLLFAGMYVAPWLKVVGGVEPHTSALRYRLRAMADDARVAKYAALQCLPAGAHPKIAKAGYWRQFYQSRAAGYRAMARDHAAVSALLERIDAADALRAYPRSKTNEFQSAVDSDAVAI